MPLYLLWDRQAAEDVEKIWLYIAQDNPDAADRLADKIGEKCRPLAQFPDLGMSRPELAAGVRSFPVGNYLIFYRVQGDALQIIRILHGARDIDTLFGL